MVMVNLPPLLAGAFRLAEGLPEPEWKCTRTAGGLVLSVRWKLPVPDSSAQPPRAAPKNPNSRQRRSKRRLEAFLEKKRKSQADVVGTSPDEQPAESDLTTRKELTTGSSFSLSQLVEVSDRPSLPNPLERSIFGSGIPTAPDVEERGPVLWPKKNDAIALTGNGASTPTGSGSTSVPSADDVSRSSTRHREIEDDRDPLDVDNRRAFPHSTSQCKYRPGERRRVRGTMATISVLQLKPRSAVDKDNPVYVVKNIASHATVTLTEQEMSNLTSPCG